MKAQKAIIRILVIWATQALTLLVLTLFLDGLKVDRIGAALLAVDGDYVAQRRHLAAVELYSAALRGDHVWDPIFCPQWGFCLVGGSVYRWFSGR